MDYFNDAFGAFNPQIDPHAAVKFVINCILIDDRLDELTFLLTEGHDIGGIEGEPAWIVERRDTGASGDMPGYADWPTGVNFRVYVEQESYDLAHPEEFFTMDEFHNYVRKAIGAYILRNPSKTTMVNAIISKLTR